LLNREAAVASVRRLAALPNIEAVLVGDGWPVFRDGGDRLLELAATL
ncbi:MBL fold metallo-hydrolase, partial [Nodularia spumigena CS-587/03]|nr:MBL fold metallo-hydrolase [Nodularia spumigena CS-587/03]